MKLYKEQVEALIRLVEKENEKTRAYRVNEINYNILLVNLEEMLEEAK